MDKTMAEPVNETPRLLKVGVVMDPISGIKAYKDSTFAMLLEAQRRGHSLYYMEPGDLYARDGRVFARMQKLVVRDNRTDWFSLSPSGSRSLDELDIVLMRRDPPFDMDYIYTSYMLELAEKAGTLVINRPQSLRDANEKFFINNFPQCCVPMLISSSSELIRTFVSQHGYCVVKPLDGMGGESVFQVRESDLNLNVILETITRHDRRPVMAQKFIDEISAGDKRILIVNGEPIPYALARFPGAGDFRGNLAKGGSSKGVPLSERDLWICSQVAPELKQRGILFAGLDVIGDWLSEVNVTSPTCIRELDAEFGLNIAAQLFDAAEEILLDAG
ncbi:MAG: glutathione synthase [Gammaproteobacteria bacterium]|nr:MAG: glutathione synthase [Gammaproteobacteria bacterium]